MEYSICVKTLIEEIQTLTTENEKLKRELLELKSQKPKYKIEELDTLFDDLF